MLSLYNHVFSPHWMFPADIPPTYGGTSGSYLSIPLTFYQTDEIPLSGETRFPHKPFSTRIRNIGKLSKGFQERQLYRQPA